MSDDRVLLDEVHVSVYAPTALPDDQAAGPRARLAGKGFRRTLQRAVRRLLRRDGTADRTRGQVRAVGRPGAE